MRVCVLPVPGGPWMRAISRDASAKRMADFWDSLRDGVSHSMSSAEVVARISAGGVGSERATGVGDERPNATRVNGV